MPPAAATVEDDQDLDDLDDFLPSFTAKSASDPVAQPTAGPSKTSSSGPLATATAPTTQTGSATSGTDADDPEEEELDDEAFEAELAKGMESLLKGLGVANPASGNGGSNVSKGKRKVDGKGPPGGTIQDGDDESEEDEAVGGDAAAADKALEQLFAKLMAGGDLGSDPFGSMRGGTSQPVGSGSAKANGTAKGKSKPNPASGGQKETSSKGSGQAKGQGQKMTLDETIQRTMENLKTSEADARTAPAPPDDPLAALLASLSSLDPETLKSLGSSADGEEDDDIMSSLNALKGLGGAGFAGLGDLAALAGGAGGADGEDGLGGMLDGMMKQLMTREILEEPLQELGDKFPAYLSTHSSTLPKADLERYRSQQTIVNKILGIFASSGYSDDDESTRKEISELMTRMQDLGSPPDEIMGDMPDGFDFENGGCSIM